MSCLRIRQAVKKIMSPIRASHSARYFKTGPGQYGYGDKFAGLTSPQCRKIAKDNEKISHDELQELIKSQTHEQRFIALLIMNKHFASYPEKIFHTYLKNTQFINNWDLVDCSAPNIVGKFLLDKKDRSILDKLCKSDSLWERRISIISTFTFIKNNQFEDTIRISQQLLSDKQDLIHKGVGWMLREVGKRDMKLLESFLQEHHKKIPRTAFRYAIEKFQESKRKAYLKGQF